MLVSHPHRRSIRPERSWAALMGCLVLCLFVTGCAGFRLPAIDPSGERIFLPPPNYSALDDGSSFSGPAWTSPPQAPFAGTPAASVAVVPYSINTPTPPLYGPFSGAPQPYGAPLPYSGPQASPLNGMPSAASAPTQLSGLTSLDPRDGIQGRLEVQPTRVLAPVGQEVILLASICGTDGYMVTGEPLEWTLAPNSVGTIVEVDQQNKAFWRQLLHRPPYKREAGYARGLTSRAAQVIPRGTPSPADDLWLDRGRTWISLTSASEGATHIHCLAPTVAGWEQRRASTTIHWVDGMWDFPPPAIGNAASGTTLCTRIARATTGAPLDGWLVAYEITGGTPATFNNGAQAAEVRSDTAGNACVRVTPQEQSGVTHLRMRVVRTGRGTSDATNISVGEGTTTITWSPTAPASPVYIPPPGTATEPANTPPANTPPSLPNLGQPPSTGTTLPPAVPQVELSIDGPRKAKANAELPYTIRVRNTGRAAANDLEIACKIPLGMRLVRSEPEPYGEFGDRVVWRVPVLPPGQSREFIVRQIVEQGGSIRVRATVDYPNGLRQEEYANTDVELSALSVDVRGPATASIGQPVRTLITITNHSNRTLTNVQLMDNFDSGLVHEAGKSPILANIESLGPNETHQEPLDFKVLGAGQLCNDVTVTAADGSEAKGRWCIDAGGSGSSGPLFGGSAFGDPVGRAAFVVQKTGPVDMQVGMPSMFQIRITNTGQIPLNGLRVLEEFDERFTPKDATEGVRRNGRTLRWGDPPQELPQLAVGATTTIEVVYIGDRPADSACNRVTVTSNEGVTERDEVCVRILDRGVKIPSMRNPVAVADPVQTRFVANRVHLQGIIASNHPESTNGPHRLPSPTASPASMLAAPPASDSPSPPWHVDINRLTSRGVGQDRLTYTVNVTNRASITAENVTLTIESPPGAEFSSSINPPMIRDTRHSRDGRTVEFLPITSLRPHETATFQIVVARKQRLEGPFRAKINSDRWPKGSVFTDE